MTPGDGGLGRAVGVVEDVQGADLVRQRLRDGPAGGGVRRARERVAVASIQRRSPGRPRLAPGWPRRERHSRGCTGTTCRSRRPPGTGSRRWHHRAGSRSGCSRSPSRRRPTWTRTPILSPRPRRGRPPPGQRQAPSRPVSWRVPASWTLTASSTPRSHPDFRTKRNLPVTYAKRERAPQDC